MRLFTALLFLGISTAFAGGGLPEHTIAEKSRLPEGMRIQLNSDDGNLTKEQCIALINAYRNQALKGQVSVHKPSTIKALEGAVFPFCVENFDDEGITFNTSFHPDPE